MKCPYCGAEESKVIDSRPTEDNERIRRRRECLNCHMRFTTYEVVETVPLVVIKKDNSREPFDRQKLFNAMLRACAKRPVSYETLERAVSSIEQSLFSSYDREIPSVRIVDLFQFLHGQLTDAHTRHLAVIGAHQGLLDAADGAFQRLVAHRTLGAGPKHRVEQLLPVERLTGVILFDDDERHRFHDLVGREPHMAVQALPAAADALAVFGRAGVDDFGFLSATIGAFHGRSS